MNFFRLRSLLWHLMGPGLLAALLLGGRSDIALTTMEKLHSCFMAALGHGRADVHRSAARSWLAQRFQRACYDACAEDYFLVPPVSVVTSCETTFALGTTKVIEDAWQRVRSMEDRAQCNKAVPPQTIWFTEVQRRVASEIHHWPEVDFRSCDPRAVPLLPKVVPRSAFDPKGEKDKLNAQAMVSTTRPDWFSPNPTTAAVMYADAAGWAQCMADPSQWQSWDRRWLSSLLLSGLLVRKTGNDSSCFFVLGCIDRVAALAWRCETTTTGSQDLPPRLLAGARRILGVVGVHRHQAVRSSAVGVALLGRRRCRAEQCGAELIVVPASAHGGVGPSEGRLAAACRCGGLQGL